MEETTKVTSKEETVSPESKSLPPLEHISPLASFLSISNQTPKETEQLNYIYGEMRQDKDYNEGDILHKLRSVEQRVGMPALGETRLSKVYNYLRAQEQVRKAEKLRDSYLR